MSFILDALKKSENQRQAHFGPSLADAPVRRRQEDRPWWVVLVAALLVVNLGVLLIVLMRDGSKSQAQAAAVPAEAQAAAGGPSAARSAPAPQPVPAPPAHQLSFSSGTEPVAVPAAPQPAAASDSPAVRSLADEAGVPYGEGPAEYQMPMNPALAAAANVPAGPPRVRPIEPPVVTPLSAQPATGRSTPPQTLELVPTAAEAAAGGTNVPELHLDIHVYSPAAAERFVFINMRKYVEGDTLNEGPVLERIREDGVVLNQRGTRYLLPRQ